MAKGSFNWQPPDLKEKVKEGTVRNHPTNSKLKQQYKGGKWVNISVTRFTSKGGGAPNQGTKEDKARRVDKVNRADPKNTQYFFRGKKVSKERYDSISGSLSRFKSTKYVAPKPTPKDKGGKVTYKHRNTSSETGIEMSGGVVVRRPGDKDAIRNNVKPKESGNQGTTETAKSDKKQETEKKSTPTTVFTKHYKTGKELGVMTRRERRAYEKEAGTKTWESEVAKHHKDKKTPKHLKETKYKASLRKKLKATKKKNEDDDKKNRTGSAFVGTVT